MLVCAQSLLFSYVAGKLLGVLRSTLMACIQVSRRQLVLPALYLFPNHLPLVFGIFPQVLGLLLSELGFPLLLFQKLHAHSSGVSGSSSFLVSSWILCTIGLKSQTLLP